MTNKKLEQSLTSKVSHKSLYIRNTVKFLICHSRGSNRESIFFEKQGNLDSRLRGNDGQWPQANVKKRETHDLNN
jgi:hypothetical protein